MMLLKKAFHDKLVEKVNNTDTSMTQTKQLENKIPNTTGLIKKTDYNVKITEIEGKVPSISGLATNTPLTAVEEKIPNVSSLVKEQIITQKLLEFKKNLLIMVMINILLIQNLILQLLEFLMQDYHKKI